MDTSRSKRGVALLSVFMVMVTLSMMALAFLNMVRDDIKRTGTDQEDMRAYYIAKAGLAKARWALTAGAQAVGWGETGTAFGAGTYTVTTTDNGGGTYTGPTGTMTGTNVQMNGTAAGTNTGIGPGNFSGTAAGTAQ